MSKNNIFDELNIDQEKIQEFKNSSKFLQNKVASMQKLLSTIETEGIAGLENYTVKIVLNGRHEAIKVKIDPHLFTQQPEILCELIASAITDASHKIDSTIQNKMLGLINNNQQE